MSKIEALSRVRLTSKPFPSPYFLPLTKSEEMSEVLKQIITERDTTTEATRKDLLDKTNRLSVSRAEGSVPLYGRGLLETLKVPEITKETPIKLLRSQDERKFKIILPFKASSNPHIRHTKWRKYEEDFQESLLYEDTLLTGKYSPLINTNCT